MKNRIGTEKLSSRSFRRNQEQKEYFDSDRKWERDRTSVGYIPRYRMLLTALKANFV